jgi:hypothetical protein
MAANVNPTLFSNVIAVRRNTSVASRTRTLEPFTLLQDVQRRLWRLKYELRRLLDDEK